MSVAIIVGAQWGDEGKGKVVDLYAPFADMVVRYGGGANAGHTLVVDGAKTVLHLVPSGALHKKAKCVLGQGMVIDPTVLLEEIAALGAHGLADPSRLFVSNRAHVVLPYHAQLDELRDAKQGQGIGTTKRGIGPCYEDKAARRGIRMGDLLSAAVLSKKVDFALDSWAPVFASLGGAVPDRNKITAQYEGLGKRLAPFITDTGAAIAESVRRGEHILLEGAQGTMLDVDQGTYPFVTSSNVVAGAACGGAGIGPSKVRRVIGISKAYTTRVGGGPFPTELSGDVGERLRKVGGEYGATTGRPRRCGWLDAPALRYAVRVNGLDEIALTKLDVLSGLGDISICVAYELEGKRIEEPPFDGWDRIRPVYESLPGWTENLSGCSSRSELPKNAQRYIARIEELARCPVGLISVGPDRKSVFGLKNPFE